MIPEKNTHVGVCPYTGFTTTHPYMGIPEKGVCAGVREENPDNRIH